MGQPATEQLNAPLGVLLDLVERGKLEVTQLSIGKLTADYLAQIDRLKARGVEELSDFIQLGARLIFMKSQALLPSVPDQSAEMIKLTTELADYRQTRQAALALASLPDAHTFPHAQQIQIAKPASPQPTPQTPANPELLRTAMHNVEHRQTPLWPNAGSAVPKLNLQQAMSRVLNQAANAPINLIELITQASSKTESIVWILACLELVKSGALTYTANGPNNYRFEARRG